MIFQAKPTWWVELLGAAGPAIFILLIVAFIVALVGILGIVFLFREPIKDAIRRLRKAGAAEFAAPVQQVGEQGEAQGREALATPLQDDPSTRPWEELIDAEIRAQNWNDKELLVRLKRALAHSNRLWQFNAAVRDIYGTQIFALRSMQGAPNGLGEADLRAIYSEHELRVLENPTTTTMSTDFLRWLAYLQDWKLIGLQEGRWVITEAGRQFLVFAGSIGATEQRAF